MVIREIHGNLDDYGGYGGPVLLFPFPTAMQKILETLMNCDLHLFYLSKGRATHSDFGVVTGDWRPDTSDKNHSVSALATSDFCPKLLASRRSVRQSRCVYHGPILLYMLCSTHMIFQKLVFFYLILGL